METATESAIMVPIPEVEAAIGVFRELLDPSATRGVPAHVTLLFPFMDPTLITEDILNAVAKAVESVDLFRASFQKMGWFGSNILWLDPEPVHAFRSLIDSVNSAFPGYPPYGGAFETHVPHLTIGASDNRGQLQIAHDRTLDHLPIDFTVTRAELWCGSRQPESWSRRAVFALGRNQTQA